MKIEITAQQAKTILTALRARRVVIASSNAPTQRKAAATSELDALRNMLAVEMLKNGFITQEDFSNGIF